MNLYSIYVNYNNKSSNLLIIKQSFSLIACIFNLFWAFYHKMWLVVTLTIIINFSIVFFRQNVTLLIPENIEYVLQFLVFGFSATEIREFYARKNGMQLSDIILAHSEEEAYLKYFIRR